MIARVKWVSFRDGDLWWVGLKKGGIMIPGRTLAEAKDRYTRDFYTRGPLAGQPIKPPQDYRDLFHDDLL